MRIFQELSIDQMTIKDRDIVFDMDGTLIEGDIGESLYIHTLLVDFMLDNPEMDWLKPYHADLNRKAVTLSDEGIEKLINYRKELSSGDYDKAYINTAERVDEFSKKDLGTLVQAFLLDEMSLGGIRFRRSNNGRIERFNMDYGVRIRPAMVKLVDYFNQQGANLWIVSASPQKVCEVIADKFGINKKYVIGTRKTDQGKNGWRFPWGPKKLEILLKAGVTHPLFVFGDGVGDVEMLDIAEYPVVIEGNSRKIIELAVKKNWWLFTG